MDTKLIEKAAMSGEMPKLLTIPEKQLFRQLRALYTEYRAGKYTREQARLEKGVIYADFESTEKLFSVMEEYQLNIRKAGTLRSEIDKAVTAEDKLRFCLECIEAMTGETGFSRRNLNAIYDQADTADKPRLCGWCSR